MKTENEVLPWAAKTIINIRAEVAEREKEIGQLKTAEGTLVELYGDPTPPVQTPRRKKAKTEKTGGASGSAPAAGDGKPDGEAGARKAAQMESLGLIRTMPEPITPAAYAVASGKEKSTAGVYLCNLAGRGWLKRTGAGEYERTKEFPSAN